MGGLVILFVVFIGVSILCALPPDAPRPSITDGDMDTFFLENTRRPPSEPMIGDEILYSGTRAGFAAAVYRNDAWGTRWMKSVMGQVVKRFESLNVSAHGAVVFKGDVDGSTPYIFSNDGYTISFVRPGVRTSDDGYLDPLVIDARDAGWRAMMDAIKARTPPPPVEPPCFVCEATFAVWRTTVRVSNAYTLFFNYAVRETVGIVRSLAGLLGFGPAAPSAGEP